MLSLCDSTTLPGWYVSVVLRFVVWLFNQVGGQCTSFGDSCRHDAGFFIYIFLALQACHEVVFEVYLGLTKVTLDLLVAWQLPVN